MMFGTPSVARLSAAAPPSRARADDEHIGLDRRTGGHFRLGESVVEGRHGARTLLSSRRWRLLCAIVVPATAVRLEPALRDGGNEKPARRLAKTADRWGHPGPPNDPLSRIRLRARRGGGRWHGN